MVRLVPGMAMEPPPGYVAFVARHLDPLRRDAARVVGGEQDADQLYPDVLTDVAVRWRSLELLRRALGRSGAADTYLGRAFARRAQRWQAEQATITEPDWDIRVFRADAKAPPPRVSAAPDQASAAVRLAPYLRSGQLPEIGAVGEAAIAWWHAYEVRRRRSIVAWCLLGLLLVALLARGVQDTSTDAVGRPAAVAVVATAPGPL